MYHPTFNIGIEEEYQMIEPESRALLGYVTQSMARIAWLSRSARPSSDWRSRWQCRR